MAAGPAFQAGFWGGDVKGHLAMRSAPRGIGPRPGGVAHPLPPRSDGDPCHPPQKRN
jgi:hypothetical protein